MERIKATQAARNFSEILNRVAYQSASFEIERNNKVIARLVPSSPRRGIKIGELNELLRHLPSLGEDANSFARDIEAFRKSLPTESDPWD